MILYELISWFEVRQWQQPVTIDSVLFYGFSSVWYTSNKEPLLTNNWRRLHLDFCIYTIFLSEKNKAWLDIPDESSESSEQTIHIKCRHFFPWNTYLKKIRLTIVCCGLVGALRVYSSSCSWCFVVLYFLLCSDSPSNQGCVHLLQHLLWHQGLFLRIQGLCWVSAAASTCNTVSEVSFSDFQEYIK